MHVLAVTWDAHTASVALRERLYWSRTDRSALLTGLLQAGCAEAALLSTCNRTDVYVVADDPALAHAVVLDALALRSGLPRDSLATAERVYLGPESCCEHLCRVASGLESVVLGETQVLGQVKEAYLFAAEEAASVGKLLHGLFHQALRCARRVHARTALAASPVSVGAAAVDLARRLLGPLDGGVALLLGAGETAETIARRLREAGFADFVVVNRSLGRAIELAERYAGRALPWDRLDEALAEVDLVLTSTAADRFVLTADRLRHAVGRRRRGVVIIDVAVPRNVDPAVAELEGVRLLNIDDLREAASQGLEERRRAAQEAEVLIAEAVADFRQWWNSLDVVPTITALREHFEQVAQGELERSLRRLGDLSPRQRRMVEQLAHGIIGKLLNDPLQKLKELSGSPYGHEAVRALRFVFALPVDDPHRGQQQPGQPERGVGRA